jgi:hypothetical protein
MTPRLTIALTGGVLACAALLVASFDLASAQAATKFGSDLHNKRGKVVGPNRLVRSCRADSTFPLLDGTKPCDRIATRFIATGTVGHTTSAPKTGTIKALRLVAWTSGHFRFELARLRGYHPGCKASGCKGKARIVRRGPRIKYKSSLHGDHFRIQTFPVHQHVRKGEYLGIKARKESLLSCKRESGFHFEQMMFQPVLPFRGGFKRWDSYGDCTLLLQAVYR